MAGLLLETFRPRADVSRGARCATAARNAGTNDISANAPATKNIGPVKVADPATPTAPVPPPGNQINGLKPTG